MRPLSGERKRGWGMVCLLTVLTWNVGVASADAQTLAQPTPQQYAWHEQERIMFVCLDPATWQGREYDDHSVPLKQINPARLDTDQWCRAAELWGAKQILFVAKHTGGFCWWHTETSRYGIKETAWQDGKGDVLAELSASCKKHGLNLGVYVYPGDDTWGAPMGSGGRTSDPAKQEAYNAVYRQQLTEVLARYGAITEVWFDGSCAIDVGDVLRQYAAEAVIFQGPQASIRWPGTESGILPYPAWNSLKRTDLVTGAATAAQGSPDGDAWAPLEADTPLYNHFWFWAAEKEAKRKSLAELMNIYYKSAGRGGVLLLNSTPNTDGLIPEADMQLYDTFGKEIERRFGTPLAQTCDQIGEEIELVLSNALLVNHAVVMEDYRKGERIREYVIEGFDGTAWINLSSGTSVGRKKIDLFHSAMISKARLRVTRAAAPPLIRAFRLFYVEGIAEGSLTTHRPTTASAYHSGAYIAEMATDNDPSTRWGTPDGTTACWLEVDLGESVSFGKVAISELADRIQAFSLEYRDDTQDAWQTVFNDTTIGAAYDRSFPPVSGRYVRLNIAEATGPPTVWEFHLYPAQAIWKRCGAWKESGSATIQIDLSPFIPRPGQYELRLETTAGSPPMKIMRATLLFEGSEATPGLLTQDKDANVFNINRTAQVTPETRSAIQIEINAESGSEGMVWIRPSVPK